MKCPKCRRKLVISGYSVYENLIEHVTDPNGPRSNKAEYRCPKLFRKCYSRRAFWDEFGDVYIPPSIIERMLWKLNLYGLTGRLEVPGAIKDD